VGKGRREHRRQGPPLKGNLRVVHVEIVQQYAPTKLQAVSHFLRNFLDGTVNAQTVNCSTSPELNPDECDSVYGGDFYYDDYDVDDNAIGVYSETVTVTAVASSASTLDITMFTSWWDPWDFSTLDYSLDGANFDPDEQQIPKPPPEHTFQSIPCSNRAAIGLKMASLIFEKAAIAAGAGALAGAASVPTPATALEGFLAGGIFGFNSAGLSGLLYYQTEYQLACVLKWINTHHLDMQPPPVETVPGVSSERP